MSNSEEAGRETRGKGKQKAGQGTDDEMEDDAASEQAKAAQETVDAFSDDHGESFSGQSGTSTAGSSRSSENQRERQAIQGIIHAASTVTARAFSQVGDEVMDDTETILSVAQEWIEGEDE